MTLRDLERESIRAFVQSAADDGYLAGRVLDYGCGKQPYRDLVEAAGGTYIPYDDPKHPGSVVDRYVGDWQQTDPVDAILCTQVLQYVPRPYGLLAALHEFQAALVLTYPTNWPEVEPEDLHRFTKAGMERLLTEAGFSIVRHERRAVVKMANVDAGGWTTFSDAFALGYGVIARA